MVQNCELCKQKEKDFKILEVQLKFQIKKLNEDMAHQKLTLQMAHQSQTRRLMEKLNFNKNQRQLENKSWMHKYDAITQLYEEKLNKTQQKCEETIAEIKHSMAIKQQSTSKQLQFKLTEKIATVKEQNQDYIKKLFASKQQERKHLLKRQEEDINKLNKKHKEEIDECCQEIEKLKTIIDASEAELSNNKIIIYDISLELAQKNEEIKHWNEKIHMIQKRIRYYFEPEIAKKQKQNGDLIKYHESKCLMLREELKCQKQRVIKEMNKKIQQILEREYEKCLQYQRKLKQLDELKQKQIKLCQLNLEEFKKTSQEKFIPRSKFQEEMSTLKVRLTSKEKDIQRAKEQIKQCKLQIENNDEILNKFFKTTSTAPDIFIHTAQNKKKDYKIKKNRVSMNGTFLEVSRSPSHITSMECLDKHQDFQPFTPFKML